MAGSLRDQLTDAFDKHEPDGSAVVETTETAVVETPETAPEKPGRTAGRERDEHGKLLPGPAKKPDLDAAPAVERPKVPSSWKKDYWGHWDKLDPSLAKYIDQREQEFAKGVSTYKQEWERAKPVLDAITPFAQEFQKYGVKPEQWIQNLGAAHQALALGNPQQKLQMFAKLAHDYGVPLQALMPRQPQIGPDGQPVPQQQPLLDPRVAAWLQQQIGGVKSEIGQWKQQQAQAQAAQLEKDIQAFATDAHPHFEAVKATMADLLDKGLATELQGAYDIALRLPQHDDIRAADDEAKRKQAEAKRASDAAQQAARAKKNAVSVKSSSPGAAPTEGKKGLREQLSAAFDSHEGRV